MNIIIKRKLFWLYGYFSFLYFLSASLNTEESLESLSHSQVTHAQKAKVRWSLTVCLKFPTVINLVRLFRTLVSVIGEYVAIEIVQWCRKPWNRYNHNESKLPCCLHRLWVEPSSLTSKQDQYYQLTWWLLPSFISSLSQKAWPVFLEFPVFNSNIMNISCFMQLQ